VRQIYDSGYYMAGMESRTKILLVDAWKHVNTAYVKNVPFHVKAGGTYGPGVL
jgi:hypothetical protein